MYYLGPINQSQIIYVTFIVKVIIDKISGE